MPIDGIFMSALCRELNGLLANGRIQAVNQPREEDVVLQVRQPGATYRLLISVHPEAARVHLTRTQERSPLSPPPFCLLLRKHLIPGRILEVVQPPFERSLTLRIEGFSPEGGRIVRHLVAEVMGRHSNLVLVDAASGLIVDALKRIPRDVNSYREILPGRPYVPPPPQEKEDPETVERERFDFLLRTLSAQTPIARGLQQRFLGFSPFAAREVVARAGLDPDVRRGETDDGQRGRVWEAMREVLSSLRAGRHEPTAVRSGTGEEFWCLAILTLAGETRRFPTLQELLDDHFERRLRGLEIERTRGRLRSAVGQHLARVERKIEHQRAALESAGRAEEFRQLGELLTANLFRLKDLEPGRKSVAVPDYFGDGSLREVPLDPGLSPGENAQAYFRRYQKARKTIEKAGEQLRASQEERAYLESVQVALDLADELEALREIAVELERLGYLERRDEPPRGGRRQPERREAAGGASRPMRYRTSDGFAVLVGRNNRQNDEITLRTAGPEDLWFHTQEIPGAHVILLCRGADPPPRSLVEAATIAAFHSKARNSANVPVDYTRCKYVRKPRGAKPGMVIYEHQKTLFVTPTPEALAALDEAR